MRPSSLGWRGAGCPWVSCSAVFVLLGHSGGVWLTQVPSSHHHCTEVSASRTVGEGEGDIVFPLLRVAFRAWPMQKELSMLQLVEDAPAGAGTAETHASCPGPRHVTFPAWCLWTARVVLFWPIGCGQPGGRPCAGRRIRGREQGHTLLTGICLFPSLAGESGDDSWLLQPISSWKSYHHM